MRPVCVHCSDCLLQNILLPFFLHSSTFKRTIKHAVCHCAGRVKYYRNETPQYCCISSCLYTSVRSHLFMASFWHYSLVFWCRCFRCSCLFLLLYSHISATEVWESCLLCAIYTVSPKVFGQPWGVPSTFMTTVVSMNICERKCHLWCCDGMPPVQQDQPWHFLALKYSKVNFCDIGPKWKWLETLCQA